MAMPDCPGEAAIKLSNIRTDGAERAIKRTEVDIRRGWLVELICKRMIVPVGQVSGTFYFVAIFNADRSGARPEGAR